MSLWSDIVAWFEERIGQKTNEIRQWVIDALDKATAQIRVWKLNIKLWLTEFTSTALGFWLFIGAIIAGVVLVALVKSSELYLKYQAFVQQQLELLKNRIGTTLAYVGYSALLALHNVAMIFVPEYKAAWVEIYDGLAAISEELRLGIEGINAALNAAKAFIKTGLTIGGFIEVGAWEEADRRVGEWLNKLEYRLERYARDPHLIFLDIDEELVSPALEEMNSGVANILADIATLNGTIHDKSEELIKLRNEFETFVNSLPDTIADNARAFTEQMFTRFDTFRETYLDPLIDYTEQLQEEFDRLQENAALRTSENEYKLALPGNLLMQIHEFIEPYRGWQLRLVAFIAGLTQREDAEKVTPYVQQQSVYIESAASGAIADRSITQAIEMPLTAESRQELARRAFDTWFVGEY